jgi:hypothetical protein
LGAIFLSYRRSDSAGESGRLSDELVARFGERRVFMDVDAIQPGRDFRKAIHENVSGCTVLLAMIGPEWLETRSASGGRRLDSENDYVRLEIATALKRDIAVVPVLVRGARMPKADQLPEELRELAYRNSVELTHARWKSDVQVLTAALAPLLDCETPRSAVPDTSQQGDTAAFSPRAAAYEAKPVGSLDQAAVERIGRELAVFIGPIADVVVKRAAKRSASLPELCDLVANEIEASGDRARFLASCRR